MQSPDASGSSRGVTSSFTRQPNDVVRLPQIQLGRAFISPSPFILPPFNCHGAGPIPIARTSGEKPQHKARNVSRARATAGMGEAKQVPEPSSESALTASCCSLGNLRDNTVTGPKSHITLWRCHWNKRKVKALSPRLLQYTMCFLRPSWHSCGGSNCLGKLLTTWRNSLAAQDRHKSSLLQGGGQARGGCKLDNLTFHLDLLAASQI